MKPTDILEAEHRIIERVLACLEKMADLSEQSKKFDVVAARDMIDFFRMFADRFHHAKEEQHLFTALEAFGMPREGGPTGVMLAEHDMGRAFVGSMEKSVNAYEQGDLSALTDFIKAARAYVPLLREHIQKEDHCLFAMAKDNLGDDEQAQLLQSFRDEEAKVFGGKGHDLYVKKAQELTNHFQIKPLSAGGDSLSACGHSKAGGCSGF